MNIYNKIMIGTIIIGIILLTGCTTDKNIGDCNGIKYSINESHCVENCPTDCYGRTICGRGESGCYPSHCYGWNINGQFINGCMDNDILCDKGNYGCTASIHTYAQDKIDADNALAAQTTAKMEADKIVACWANGTYYNYTFDIIRDYNLSCDKLAYINDHLIDKTRQVDGGYISGEYSGFISHGEIEGHLYQYVTEGILATGQLIKNVNYQLDCNNQTRKITRCASGISCGENCCVNSGWETVDDKSINYYSESDFVMYYVNHCIGGNK